MADTRQGRVGRGRPPSTTREQVAHTALALFVRDGFEETTLDRIAEAVGIGRRTLFGYFASKNDMVWGDFDAVLDRLREELAATAPDEPVMDAVARAVVASNRYDGEALEELRLRMTLITTVPALQAHSMVRYDAWRAVVAEFVGRRLGQPPDAYLPLTVGYMALAASMSAFVRWVQHPHEDIEDLLRRGYAHLARAFEGAVGA
jgi:TetR/AcrR family transcriptional regulator, regulator of mycofactocin system